MLNAFYTELVQCVKPLNIDEVHYSFVDKDIDDSKTYITYYRVSKQPDYELNIFVSTVQVSIFSKELEIANKVRNHISMHFSDMNKIILDTEICGTTIESEMEEYDYENKLYQAITTIKLLYKK